MTIRDILRGEDKATSALVLIPAIIVVLLDIGLVQDLLLRLPLLPVLGERGLTGLMTVVLFGLMIGAAILWAAIAGRSVTPTGASPLKAGGLGIALGVGGLLLATGYAAMTGGVQPAGHPPAAILLILAGTCLTFIQCSAEEIYFRGWIQPVLAGPWGKWAALGMTSLLFAALHIFAGVRAPLSMLNVFLAGVLFGLLALRTGGLVAPIAAHFAWDWSEGLLMGLFPNPGVDVWNAIFNFDLTGSRLWGGSAEGLNNSLAVTFVLLAFCVPLAWSLIRPSEGRAATAA